MMRLICLSIFLLLFICPKAIAQNGLVAPIVNRGYLAVVDTSGHIITDSIYRMDEANLNMAKSYPDIFFNEGIFQLERSGKYGLMDWTGRVIAPFIFMHTQPFKHGCAAVFTYGSRWGLINNQGEYIADTIYDYVSDANDDGVIVLRQGDHLAVIDTTGQFIVPFYYKTDTRLFGEPQFSDGLLRVMVVDTASNQRKWSGNINDLPFFWRIGFVDKTGKLVIDTVYTLDGALRSSEEDFSYNSVHRRICLSGVAAHKKRRPPLTYRVDGDFYRFDHARCLVIKDHQPLIINKKGEAIFAILFAKGLGPLIKNSGGFFTVDKRDDILQSDLNGGDALDGNNEVYDPYGKNILHFGAGKVTKINDSLLVIESDIAYSNGIGSFYLNQVFDTGGKFKFKAYCNNYGGSIVAKCGLSEVAEYGSNRTGYVNLKGKFFPDDHRNIRINVCNDDEGFVAWHGKKMGIIDANFKWVIPPAFEGMERFCNGFAAAQMNGKWGYVSKNGTLKIPYKYDVALPFRWVE